MVDRMIAPGLPEPKTVSPESARKFEALVQAMAHATLGEAARLNADSYDLLMLAAGIGYLLIHQAVQQGVLYDLAITAVATQIREYVRAEQRQTQQETP